MLPYIQVGNLQCAGTPNLGMQLNGAKRHRAGLSEDVERPPQIHRGIVYDPD